MIRCHYISRSLPIVFIGTNWLPKHWIATSLGLVVLIKKSHFSDWPTIAHELEHCKQSIKGLGLIHFYRYHRSPNYRLRCEAAAFAAEISCCEGNEIAHRTAKAIESIVHCYRLNCGVTDVSEAIQIELRKLKL